MREWLFRGRDGLRLTMWIGLKEAGRGREDRLERRLLRTHHAGGSCDVSVRGILGSRC